MFLLFFMSNNVFASHNDDPIFEDTTLSKEEINAYLTGVSLDLDKVADIYHFPNPKRVLELKGLLRLTRAQKNRTVMSYQLMRKYTIRAGRDIVRKESRLNQLFQQSDFDLEVVEKLVNEIAVLKGKLRFAHLKARVKQKGYLGSDQLTVYFQNNTRQNSAVYAFDE